MIRDLVRDEAIACAKAWSRPEVEPCHVLWGLIEVLRTAAPTEVPAATVKQLLEPHGTSYQTPTVSAAAEAALATIDSDAAAPAAAIALLKQIQGGGDGAAPGGTGAGGTPPGGTPQNGETPPDSGAGVPGTTADGTTPPASGTSTAGSVATTTTDATTADAAGPAPSNTKETTDQILAELDALVGLDRVKAAVHQLIAVQMLNAERQAAGLPEVSESLHIVFTGSPGTGKTTIARIIARLYGSIGVVSRGQLIECSRADLVAGYVGQTALKVQEVVNRALGGVLFIDEAYSLAEEGAGEFGEEAVAMLVKLMEDHRDDLAVIVAGYPEQMRQFIDSNPGLRSRFTHYIDFPDYSPSELVLVFQGFADTAKVRLGPGVADQLAHLFELALRIGNFGNARYARSLFEDAYANLATRAFADGHIDRAEDDQILVEDLPAPDPQTTTTHRIGFQQR